MIGSSLMRGERVSFLSSDLIFPAKCCLCLINRSLERFRSSDSFTADIGLGVITLRSRHLVRLFCPVRGNESQQFNYAACCG